MQNTHTHKTHKKRSTEHHITTNSTGQQKQKTLHRTKGKAQNGTKKTRNTSEQKNQKKHRKYITEYHTTAQNSTGEHMSTQNKKHITEEQKTQ